jgi:hypothetical protein
MNNNKNKNMKMSNENNINGNDIADQSQTPDGLGNPSPNAIPTCNYQSFDNICYIIYNVTINTIQKSSYIYDKVVTLFRHRLE